MENDNQSEPIHVQVARALGCSPLYNPILSAACGQEVWSCNCVPFNANHGVEDYEGNIEIFLPLYNSWQSIGPLIDEFDILFKTWDEITGQSTYLAYLHRPYDKWIVLAKSSLEVSYNNIYAYCGEGPDRFSSIRNLIIKMGPEMIKRIRNAKV